MERKFHGSESSLYGLFAPGNESAEERKGLESPICGRRPVRRGGGSRRKIAIPFGMEKLEWLGYPMVKQIRRYLYSF